MRSTGDSSPPPELRGRPAAAGPQQAFPPPSPDDLRRRYEELQLRVTQFAATELKLVKTRDLLDRERVLHTRMGSFNAAALQEITDQAFIDLVADAIADIFEVEVGIIFVSGMEQTPSLCYGVVGVELGPDLASSLFETLHFQLAQQSIGKVRHFGNNDLEMVQAHLPLHQALAMLHCKGPMEPVIILLGANTDAGAPFHEPIVPERGEAFAVFAQQVAAHLGNRRSRRIIERQVEQIKRSEERLLLAIRGADLGSWDWDIRTGRAVFNDRWASMLGYELKELPQYFGAWRDLIHPDDLGPADVQLQRHLDGLSPQYEIQVRMRAKSGDWRWILSRGSVVERCPQGRPLRAAGTHLDITEERLAKQALLKSEIQYRTLVDSVTEVVFQTDTAGHWLMLGKAWERIMGFSTDEVLGQPFLNCMHPDDRRASQETFRALIERRQEHCSLESRFVTKTGKVCRFEIRARLTLDERGEILGVAGSMRDVAETRRAEDYYRELVDNLPDPIYITQEDRFVYANQAAAHLFGAAGTAQLLGQSILDRLHPDHRRLVDSSAGAPLASVLEERQYVRLDGSVVDVEVRAGEINWGNKPARQVIVRNITERKQLEDQLRQAQKMESIGRLAGGIAHDFNNMLAVIQGRCCLLSLGGALTDRQKESADEIMRATDRAASLTRQLLLFSRRQALQLQDLDLNESVASITKMLQRLIGEDIQIQCRYAPKPIKLRADAGMLDQVLLNLAVNSRDAMPEGGQLLLETVEAELDERAAAGRPGARPGKYGCLRVIDTGSGIAPEILPRIFEPFFTTKEVGKGTGLGLATAFGIVQQHHGWIEVQSEVGKGTTFQIFLPQLPDKPAAYPAKAQDAEASGGKENILLVDDEEPMRIMVGLLLSELGYRVMEAGTGAEALEVWNRRGGKFDLVLTDLVMPGGMSGLDLTQLLLQKNPGLKIVYMSGYSPQIAGKDIALSSGAAFLSKPFNLQKLAQTIRQQLDQPPPAP